MGALRRLADAGSTVVLTTHSLQDLAHCDRIVFLAQGRLAFAGTREEALAYFEVDTLEEVYHGSRRRAPLRSGRPAFGSEA